MVVLLLYVVPVEETKKHESRNSAIKSNEQLCVQKYLVNNNFYT